MSNYVFVIDTNKQPQNPLHPAQARLLLNQGQSAVYRRYPFTVILKESKTTSEIQQIT
ncbi:RRXRR domain-containing protein, partial [Laspinema sp. D1]|nr:RRXRR domain-containing protein [Laspinema sp. D2a]